MLHFYEFRQLLQEHKIDFPSTTAEEIDDRSKGDALSKGIALLQITWFIIQLIARRVQGLTITELELTTAALAGLNSVMYVFWWNKCQGPDPKKGTRFERSLDGRLEVTAREIDRGREQARA